MGGCKRFTSGHGIAGTVSGVKADFHCGDKLWFSVGMEVSVGPMLASARYRFANALYC